jgi:hypothetical protein
MTETNVEKFTSALEELATPHTIQGTAVRPTESDVVIGMCSPYLVSRLVDLSYEDYANHTHAKKSFDGFKNVPSLRMHKGRRVLLSYGHVDEIDLDQVHLVIVGSMEGPEKQVKGLKGSGTLIGRYSIFYGHESGYTNTEPGEGGYALDFPKDSDTLKKALADDSFIDAVVARDEGAIREALKTLADKVDEPILATSYLTEALKL